MPKSLSSDAYRRAIDVLIAARAEAQITQVDLALRLGRPQSYVSKFERLERRLDLIEYAEVATALGYAPLDLIKRALG